VRRVLRWFVPRSDGYPPFAWLVVAHFKHSDGSCKFGRELVWTHFRKVTKMVQVAHLEEKMCEFLATRDAVVTWYQRLPGDDR